MARPSGADLWRIPLFAGTETAKAQGLTYDPNDLVGQLPGLPACALPGLVLWLDPSATSTVRTDTGGRVYRWNDRSGQQNHATQGDVALRPTYTEPTSVDFGTA